MNQVTFNLIFGLVLRGAIMMLAGWLVAHGLLPQGNLEEWVGAVVLVVLGLGWSWWEKMQKQAQIHAALALPAGSTLDDVKEKVAADKAPGAVAKSLLPFVLLAGLLTPACAAKQYPTLPPETQRQIDATEMGKRVNALMDTAIDAEGRTLIPTPVARAIIQWCVDADRTLLQYPSGWGPTLAQAWLGLKNNPLVKPLLLTNQYIASAATLVDIALAVWTPKTITPLEELCWLSY